MTPVAGSPCAKTISFALNLTTVLPRPVESRNDFASKARPLEDPFLGERRTFTGARRVVEDTITTILRFLPAVQYCTLARLALFESSRDARSTARHRLGGLTAFEQLCQALIKLF